MEAIHIGHRASENNLGMITCILTSDLFCQPLSPPPPPPPPPTPQKKRVQVILEAYVR